MRADDIAAAAVSLVLAATLTAAAVQPAQAQSCGPYEGFVQKLKHKYKEKKTGAGVMPKMRATIEIWVSPSGSWTVIQRLTATHACMMASGRHWVDYTAKLGEPS